MFDSVPPVQGIYAILNTSNLKIYVGSSNNMLRRVAIHATELYQGRHINSALQRDWTTYGAAVFRVDAIECIECETQLIGIERAWIKRYEGRLYNVFHNPLYDPKAPVRELSPAIIRRYQGLIPIINQRLDQGMTADEIVQTLPGAKHLLETLIQQVLRDR